MTPKLSIDELVSDPLYGLLVDQEREFVLEYIRTGGDVMAASRKAFSDAKPTAHSALARRMMARPQVEAVINLFYGENEPSQEEFLKFLWKAVNEAKNDAARASLSSLYAELKGWKKTAPKNANSDSVLEGLI